MKKLILSLIVLLMCGSASFAQIDQRIDCKIKYDALIKYIKMPVTEITNTNQEMNVVFYYDSEENAIYNADKVRMEGAVITSDRIEISWDSVNNPRFCFLLDRLNNTVQYKAFFELPPRHMKNREAEPASSIEHNGQGTFTVQRI